MHGRFTSFRFDKAQIRHIPEDIPSHKTNTMRKAKSRRLTRAAETPLWAVFCYACDFSLIRLKTSVSASAAAASLERMNPA